jgi:hypothetical protein
MKVVVHEAEACHRDGENRVEFVEARFKPVFALKRVGVFG